MESVMNKSLCHCFWVKAMGYEAPAYRQAGASLPLPSDGALISK
jgi:hypothetical protein